LVRIFLLAIYTLRVAFQFRGAVHGTEYRCGCVRAPTSVCLCARVCTYVCDRFANSHARFCMTERNDRFYVWSGLSRDAPAIILNAASRYPNAERDDSNRVGGGSVLITLSVYRSRRKPIPMETTSLRLFLKRNIL